ncbi:unnamed protein product [Blepharisma stoltei]|uniref:Uncharacterized protein n=1 Tax=Blepharisma stoltei TaxID=1481888 RepID=A0AAU9K2Q2_9CILI|nr:unnamed protein product [Blepharisma stoltei]
MGAMLCASGRPDKEALNSAAYFWSNPSFKKLGKRQSPSKQYNIGVMYRGKRSILTEEELWAAKKIMRAYRNYKNRVLTTQTSLSSSFERLEKVSREGVKV